MKKVIILATLIMSSISFAESYTCKLGYQDTRGNFYDVCYISNEEIKQEVKGGFPIYSKECNGKYGSLTLAFVAREKDSGEIQIYSDSHLLSISSGTIRDGSYISNFLKIDSQLSEVPEEIMNQSATSITGIFSACYFDNK